MIHQATNKVCECFGLTQDEAHTLITCNVKADWMKLVSGKEGANFTVCSIYENIQRSKLKDNEKNFLCTHIAQHWEIYKVRELFNNNNIEGFVREILG